jgi:hypothetical protein
MRCIRTLGSVLNEAHKHHRNAAIRAAWRVAAAAATGAALTRAQPLRLTPLQAYDACPRQSFFGASVFWKQLYAAAVARQRPMPELMRRAAQAVATSGNPELSMLLTQQKLLSPYVMCAELDAHRVEVPSDTSTWADSSSPKENGP